MHEGADGRSNVGGIVWDALTNSVEEVADQHNVHESLDAFETTKGESILRNLEPLPETYHVGAEHKALFGLLSEGEDKSNYPITLRDVAAFTTFGLEYKGKRVSYESEIQQKIHEDVVNEILHRSNGLDDTVGLEDILDRENEQWERPFIDVVQRDIKKAVTEEHWKHYRELLEREKASSGMKQQEYYGELHRKAETIWREEYETDVREKLANQIKKTSKKSSARILSDKTRIDSETERQKNNWIIAKCKELHAEDIHNFVIENNLMTEDEVQKYTDYYKNRNQLISGCRKIITHDKREGSKQEYQFQSTIIEHLYQIGYRVSNNIPERMPDVFPNPNYIRERVKTSIRQYLFDPESRNRLKNPINSIKRLDSIIEGCNDETNRDVMRKNVVELELLAQKYYGELLPKYISAEQKFFNPRLDEKLQIHSERKTIRKNLANLREREAQELAIATIRGYKKKMASIVFDGDENNYDEVYVIATGLVALTRDGQLQFGAISPLDDRIMSLFGSEDQRDLWKETWEGQKDKYDKVARHTVAQEMRKQTLEVIDGFDKKVHGTLEKYQLDAPIAFNETRGQIYDTIQLSDLETIEEIAPIVAGFAKGVSLDVTEKEATLASTRIEVAKYLADGSITQSLLLVQGDCVLNIREIARLMESTTPEKIEKVYSRVASELGVSLYNHLSAKDRKTFSDIVSQRETISEVTFYKYFNRRASSAAERYKTTERTVFLGEFNRYLAGRSSDEMKAFFDRIKMNPGIIIQSNNHYKESL